MALYYIQNTGFCGNCLKWWCPDGHGYTMDLNRAWKVPEDKARSICRYRPNQDIMWPVEEIDAVASRHLNYEALTAEQRRRAAGLSDEPVTA